MEDQNLNQQPVQQPPPPTPGAQGSKRKFLLIAGVVATVLLVAGGVIYFFIANKGVEEARQKDTLIATVGEEEIYESDIVTAAQEQYDPSAIDISVMRLFLDVVIERKILELEAGRLGIEVPQNLTGEEYYDHLRKSVVPRQVQSIEAHVIDWWIPPPEYYPQEPLFEQQRLLGEQAANEIEQRLIANEPPIDIAKDIYSRYSILQTIIGLNGYLLDKEPTDEMISKPAVYEYEEESEDLQEVLFTLSEGDVSKNIWEDESGVSVIKVISVSEGERKSYDQWLEEKKDELVEYHNPLD